MIVRKKPGAANPRPLRSLGWAYPFSRTRHRRSLWMGPFFRFIGV